MGSSVQRAIINLKYSSVLRPRSLDGTPRAWNSSGAPPAPTPKMTLPSDKVSNVASIFAATKGFLYGTTITVLPNLMVWVKAAGIAKDYKGVVKSWSEGGQEMLGSDHVVTYPNRVETQGLGTLRCDPKIIGGYCFTVVGKAHAKLHLHTKARLIRSRRPPTGIARPHDMDRSRTPRRKRRDT